MQKLLLVVMVLAGCATDSVPEGGPIELLQDDPAPHDMASADPDRCALAAQLPADDICHLACDPTAMAAQLRAEGSEPGTCYQLYCALPEEQHVLVGVCLPPE